MRSDPVLDRAGVDAHLDELRSGLKAPRAARRAVKRTGGASLTRAQQQAGRRWAEAIARGEVPAEVTKARRGAKVLKGQRRRSGGRR